MKDMNASGKRLAASMLIALFSACGAITGSPEEESVMPSGSERAAMKERLQSLKEAGASVRVLVYPARVGGDHTDQTCATRLSTLLNEAKVCQATAAETGPVMEGSGWPNEMQVLRLFARNVREYVRKHPADCDYVLVEIDPFIGGADGTPFCLRWTYVKSGTWASVPLYLGGDGQPPVDLSKYKGISFSIKSLFEQPCTVAIHANAAHANRRAMFPLPIQVTKEWQKVVLTPDTHPHMNAIDPRRCYGLSFDVQADEDTANVIWIDEVKLLLDETTAQR